MTQPTSPYQSTSVPQPTPAYGPGYRAAVPAADSAPMSAPPTVSYSAAPHMPPAAYQPAPYAQPQVAMFGATSYGQPMRRSANPVHVTIAWVFAVVTGLYMLPWAIAATRAKSNSVGIAVLNALLGWTVIGWVVALIMACSAEQNVAVHNMTMMTGTTYGPPPSR